MPSELIKKIEKDGSSTWRVIVRQLIKQYPGDFQYEFKLDAEMEIYETYWRKESERLLTLRTNVRVKTSEEAKDDTKEDAEEENDENVEPLEYSTENETEAVGKRKTQKKKTTKKKKNGEYPFT